MADDLSEVTAEVSLVVTSADLAVAWDRDLPAIASHGFYVSLAELASHEAATALLQAFQTTASLEVSVRTLGQCTQGMLVTANATIFRRVHGDLHFSVEISSGGEQIAHVTHRRAVVNRVRFAQRASQKSGWITSPATERETS
ncbi:MAG: hypothetical protein JWP75_698 [Frondihabitans sp.]|nr:hypothetical protein [Frondihabitans sp.]